MKKTITIEQLEELSEKGKERLREWIESKLSPPISGSAYIGPLSSPYQTSYFMTIGQMIEFLEDNTEDGGYIDDYFDHNIIDGKTGYSSNVAIGWHTKKELCDALWEAVKEILEEDDK